MLVKNVSARGHHVGEVFISPGETKDIDKAFATAINQAELVPQEEPKVAKPAKAAKPAEPETPAAE